MQNRLRKVKEWLIHVLQTSSSLYCGLSLCVLTYCRLSSKPKTKGMLQLICFCVFTSIFIIMHCIFQLLSHVRLCDPIDCRTPGFPVLHYLPELAQTHVHWVSDAIQPSSSVIPFSFNFSQHQGLFQWVGSSHQVTKVLALQLQHQSFQWIFRTDFLQDWLVWSLRSPRDSQESSPTPQFKTINSLARES